MGLPRKGSRSISVGDAAYRWVVSAGPGHLRLTAEKRDDPGRRLLAWFHYHDSYARDPAGRWHRVGQLRSIGPALVRATTTLALEKGWEPDAKGGVFGLRDAEYCFPVPASPDERGVRLAELAREVVGDLRFDVSVDVEWRRRLFHSTPGQRFEVPRPNEHGLHFAVFFDGWTADGMWVIGIECVEFPHVLMHTFNGGAIL
ncbi:MAG TPA: hypothetical protein VH092_05490 [Urbifossiella sp.]|jgi:hypothetical protein|nr:hypothetical protein [Urbifossiella sp.]